MSKEDKKLKQQSKNMVPVHQLDERPISVGGYVGLFFCFAIPFMGFGIMFMIAVLSRNRNYKNYGTAMVIVYLIAISMSVVTWVIRSRMGLV